MKACNKCKIEKELFEFYTFKQNIDGYQNICKCCVIKAAKKRYVKKPKAIFDRSLVVSKVCFKCKIDRDKSEFSKHDRNKDGLGSYCKECNQSIMKKYNRTISKKKPPLINDPVTHKYCKFCSTEKQIEEFKKEKRVKSGYGNKCKVCVAEYEKEIRKKRESIDVENQFTVNNTKYYFLNSFMKDIRDDYYGLIIDGHPIYKMSNDEFIDRFFNDGDYSFIFNDYKKWRYLIYLVKQGIEFNKKHNI